MCGGELVARMSRNGYFWDWHVINIERKVSDGFPIDEYDIDRAKAEFMRIVSAELEWSYGTWRLVNVLSARHLGYHE